MKKLFLLFIVGSVGFWSCTEETQEAKINSEQSAAELEKSMNLMADDVVSISQTQGVEAIISFLDLFEDLDAFEERVDKKSWVKEKLSRFHQVFAARVVKRVTDDELFYFEDIIGVYEWDAMNEEFVLLDEETDYFVVSFPTEGSSTNNATFTITKLEMEEFEDDYGPFQLPTEAAAHLLVDGEEAMALTMSASYVEEDEDVLPLSASVVLDLAPYSFSVSADDTQNLSSSVSASITQSGETLAAVSVVVAFEDAAKVMPELFEGFVSFREVKVTGNVSLDGIDEDGDPNDYITMEVLLNEEKIGDVVFVLETDEYGYEDYIPYLEYLDGERALLEDVLAPFIEELEDAFEDFEG